MKASYEKVWTLAASRCQVATYPRKTKPEPGLDQQTAWADATESGSLRATRQEATEAPTAISER